MKTNKQILIVALTVTMVGCFDGDSDKGTMSSFGGMNKGDTYTHVRGGDLMATTEGAAMYDGLSGHANLVVSDDSSEVQLYATGLTANTMYPAHVHNGTCASGGGGHYLQDTNGEDVAENGLWPKLTTDETGMAMTMVMNPFMVREDAKSVVIHEPGSGTRIGCADLISSASMSGMLMPMNSGVAMYTELMGEVTVSVRSDMTSKAEVSAMGLTPSATYPAHVHVADCASGGGGHYLQDTAGADVAENGLWPATSVDAFGHGGGWASNAFAVRFDQAQSIVLHEPTSKERIACADLDSAKLAFRSGSFMTTADGMALYGDDALEGRAMLSVTPSGESTAELYLSGLNMDTQYHSHVHNGTCASGGGGHYLQDMNGEDVMSNGLWPGFMTDAGGVGQAKVTAKFIVRNDARSVVVHQPGTGARIACADLM